MSNILTTWINGKTQDLESQNGYIIKRHPLLTEAYTRIHTKKKKYKLDPLFGSELYKLTDSRIDYIDVNYVRNIIEDCLLPMKNENRVTGYEIAIIPENDNLSFIYRLTMYPYDADPIVLEANYRI